MPYTQSYSFAASPDGAQPYYGPLVSDGAGNMYGTTSLGGANNLGTVFKINTTSLAESVVYSFANGAGGHTPYSGLVRDSAGNFYGAAFNGTTGGYGGVYKIDGVTGAQSVLTSFNGGPSGANPIGGVIYDGVDTLYGTTFIGGTGNGTVYKVSISTGVRTTVHNFGGFGVGDGSQSSAALVSDGAGNYLGTTREGGSLNRGTIYRLDPLTGVVTILYSFGSGSADDGSTPRTGLATDGTGNFYGVTVSGAGTGANGIIYKLNPSTATYTVVYRFAGGVDGFTPNAALVSVGSGIFYGTTVDGGSASQGTVFSINVNTGVKTIIHNFTGTPDGANPYGTLVSDGAGYLFGTTAFGGTNGRGTVYRVGPL